MSGPRGVQVREGTHHRGRLHAVAVIGAAAFLCMQQMRLRKSLAGLYEDLSARIEGLTVSEEETLSKDCPLCERVKILHSMDLCRSCCDAAANEAHWDLPKISRYLAPQLAFAKWCADHGEKNPFED